MTGQKWLQDSSSLQMFPFTLKARLIDRFLPHLLFFEGQGMLAFQTIYFPIYISEVSLAFQVFTSNPASTEYLPMSWKRVSPTASQTERWTSPGKSAGRARAGEQRPAWTLGATLAAAGTRVVSRSLSFPSAQQVGPDSP